MQKNRNKYIGHLKKISALIFAWIFIAEFVLMVTFNFVPLLDHKFYKSTFKGLKIPKSILGWDLYNGNGRSADGTWNQKCGEVYGDSFTHGDEVVDSEAWVNELSHLAKCRIINYGVSGYGLDQASIKLGQKIDKNESGFVALGVYSEMLRRNLAGSWIFYADSSVLPLKPYFTINSAGGLELHDPSLVMSTEDDIKLHHKHDKYYEEYNITWPYLIWSIKYLIHQYEWHKNKNAYLDNVKITHPYANAAAILLAKKIIRNSALMVGERKFFVVFYPTPDEAYSDWYPYREFLTQVGEMLPKACIVDPGPALHVESQRLRRPLKAPNGHYDADGNRIIALEFYNAMRRCSL